MRDQASALEPDAERAESLLRDAALHLTDRDRLRRRVPAVGEIPHALAAAPSDHRDLAACAQHVEHQAHLADAPPPVRLAVHARVILDLARGERPPPLELTQNVTAERGVLLDVRLAAPSPTLGAATVEAHARP